MQTLDSTEFTNKHNDRVSIVLMQDSAQGFHLIVKVKMLREETEQRFIAGKLTELPVKTWTQETKLIQTLNETQAHIEFNLYRVMNGQPGYSMCDFQDWLKTTKGESPND